MALIRTNRIKGARSVSAVFSAARPTHANGLTLRAAKHGTNPTTFAVIVPSSALPLATQRNSLRRRVSERLRILLKHREPNPGFRVVLTARAVMTTADIDASLVLLLQKSGILQQ